MSDDLFDSDAVSPTADPDRRPFEPTELIIGAIFAGLGALFWADFGTDFHFDAGYVLPILLIGFGVAGLISGRGRD